jgi:riboflavin kinase/FMN adenylyltransferase
MTIGKFDGVHLGHRRMINTAIQRAHSQGSTSAVLTFDPHPAVVLRPQEDVRLLNTLQDRISLIGQLAPDLLVIAPFTRETMSTPASEYMQQLCDVLPLRELWVGEGFALGRKREGDIDRLREIGQELGYSVGKVEPVQWKGARVSSSRVREMLGSGEVAGVQELLGRPYSLRGVVVEGDKRGRTIGFPTANLAVDQQLALPADGVYASLVNLGDEVLPAVTNVGVRPTFGTLQRTVEAHLLDWSGDMYGQPVGLSFLHFLRGEQKFSGIEELQAQIAHDAEQARRLLGV